MLNLRVIAPQKVILDLQVKEIIAPAREGEFGVLTGHISFYTPLDCGLLGFRIEDKFNYYFLERGVAEIYNDKVNILVEDAYPIEELKEDKLLSERKHLLEKLSTLDSLSD